MNARQVFWLRAVTIIWTLLAGSLVVRDGAPLITFFVWLAGVLVYYAVAIKHRV